MIFFYFFIFQCFIVYSHVIGTDFCSAILVVLIFLISFKKIPLSNLFLFFMYFCHFWLFFKWASCYLHLFDIKLFTFI